MRALVLALSAGLSLTALPVSAQTLQCGPRERVLENIAAQNLSRRVLGLAGQAVMELYAEPEGARWIITVTLPDGRMCLLAQGQHLEMRDEVFPARGTRS